MKIQNLGPSCPLKTLKAPQDPQKNQQPPQESFERSDRAYDAASSLARLYAGSNTAVAGGLGGGLLVGALTEATLGVTGLSVAAGVVAGCALGFGGYVAGTAISDWAGRVGSQLDTSQPKRGEALARGVITVASCLAFTQSPSLTAFQVGAAAASGGLTYALND